MSRADAAREPAQRGMRVAHLDHTTAPGGAEYALLRMMQAGPTWRPTILLARSADGDSGVYGDVPGDIPVQFGGVRHPAGASSGRPLATVFVGVRLLAQAAALVGNRSFRRADVIDANTARAAAYASLAVRPTRKPFVVHLRDMVDPEALGPGGFALMTRLVLPRADGVVGNSRSTLDSARPYMRPEAPTTVIPSAAGLHLRREPVHAGAGEAVRTVGMLARIDRWKGQLELLEAFAKAFAGRPEIRLQFAGEPLFGQEAFLAELHSRAHELELADRVDFLGQVGDVEALLSTWDVAVQASTRPEPLGQNVLQYLAAGRVVVAADEGGPAEWITDGVNGLLVAPRDVTALAAALGRLDTDGELRVRLGAAAATTPGLLDDAAVMQAHAAFYELVVRARRAA